MRIRPRAGAIVDHRVDQVLETQTQLGAITRKQGQCCRQSATGAFAGNADAGGVDAEFTRVREHPLQAGVAVLDRTGEARLRREPVVDGHHDAFELQRERTHNRLRTMGGTRDIAAAVNVIEARQPLAVAGRSVHGERDVGRTRGPGHVQGRHRGRDVDIRIARQRKLVGTHQRQHLFGELDWSKALQQFEQCRIDEVPAAGGRFSGSDVGYRVRVGAHGVIPLRRRIRSTNRRCREVTARCWQQARRAR
jgi:hypothetical protein